MVVSSVKFTAACRSEYYTDMYRNLLCMIPDKQLLQPVPEHFARIALFSRPHTLNYLAIFTADHIALQQVLGIIARGPSLKSPGSSVGRARDCKGSLVS